MKDIKQYHFYLSFLEDGTKVYHWVDRFFQSESADYADTAAMTEGDFGCEMGPIPIQSLVEEFLEEVPAQVVAERCPKSYKELLEWIGGDDPYNPPSAKGDQP